ncbi:ExbD/TolR family protein [Siccirubricoccus deserti]
MAMHQAGGSSEDESSPMADINVTPLVDVMLVLLIVFMVTAPMMLVGVPVQLPRTAAARIAANTPPLVVTVAPGGQIYIAQELVPEAELGARITALRTGEAEDAAVHVCGDRTVPYGEVLRVLGRVRAAGSPASPWWPKPRPCRQQRRRTEPHAGRLLPPSPAGPDATRAETCSGCGGQPPRRRGAGRAAAACGGAGATGLAGQPGAGSGDRHRPRNRAGTGERGPGGRALEEPAPPAGGRGSRAHRRTGAPELTAAAPPEPTPPTAPPEPPQVAEIPPEPIPPEPSTRTGAARTGPARAGAGAGGGGNGAALAAATAARRAAAASPTDAAPAAAGASRDPGPGRCTTPPRSPRRLPPPEWPRRRAMSVPCWRRLNATSSIRPPPAGTGSRVARCCGWQCGGMAR